MLANTTSTILYHFLSQNVYVVGIIFSQFYKRGGEFSHLSTQCESGQLLQSPALVNELNFFVSILSKLSTPENAGQTQRTRLQSGNLMLPTRCGARKAQKKSGIETFWLLI